MCEVNYCDFKFYERMADPDKNAREKEPGEQSNPFSDDQMAFLRTLIGERQPPTTSKGKEPAKTSSSQTVDLGEFCRETISTGRETRGPRRDGCGRTSPPRTW